MDADLIDNVNVIGTNTDSSVKAELKEKFESMLKEQEERRNLLVIEKNNRDEHLKDPKEKITHIQSVFDKIADGIKSQIEELNKQQVLTRECVNALWDALTDLREYFSGISYSMTRYDQKNFKIEIQNLENKIGELSTKVPRQKFRFKKRVKREEKKEEEKILTYEVVGLPHNSGRGELEGPVLALRVLNLLQNKIVFVTDIEMGIDNMEVVNICGKKYKQDALKCM